MGNVTAGIRILRKPFSALMRNVTGTIVGVSTDQKVISLTFDDGPGPEFTPQLLDILEKHNAKATFFMVGEAAQEHPKLVKQIADCGHCIGNHSWDHSSFPLLTSRERQNQILWCEKATAPYGKKFFRPPYGHQSLMSHFDVLYLGYKVVTWNVMAEDWLDRGADVMVEKTANKIKCGSIVLFHDRLHTFLEKKLANRQQMLRAVDMLLEKFSNKFRFVTIDDLLKCGRAQRLNWYQQEKPNWFEKLQKETV